jgi:hypothetical protein
VFIRRLQRILVLTLRRRPSLPNESSTSGCSLSWLSLLLSSRMPSRKRDSSASTATDVSQRLTKTNCQNGLLQKQLNDLGRRVLTLVKEIARRQDPTIPSDDLKVDETRRRLKAARYRREMGAKIEAEEHEYRDLLGKGRARLCTKRMKLLPRCKNN